MPARKYWTNVTPPGPTSWSPKTDPKISSMTTGKAKMKTIAIPSRKNTRSSATTRLAQCAGENRLRRNGFRTDSAGR